MEGFDQKTLYVGLMESQAHEILEGRCAHPQESSGRFGLRETTALALERADKFWQWKIDNHDQVNGPPPAMIGESEWKLGTMRLTASGFMRMFDTNVLKKTGPPGECCWEGEGLQHELKLEDGRIAYILEISAPTAADWYNPFDRPPSEHPQDDIPGEGPIESIGSDRPEGQEKLQRIA